MFNRLGLSCHRAEGEMSGTGFKCSLQQFTLVRVGEWQAQRQKCKAVIVSLWRFRGHQSEGSVAVMLLQLP